ncbi:MAG: protein kinase [Myxococcota bacterium]|nr:protein kinase [Myxococcota bacterium]
MQRIVGIFGAAIGLLLMGVGAFALGPDLGVEWGGGRPFEALAQELDRSGYAVGLPRLGGGTQVWIFESSLRFAWMPLGLLMMAIAVSWGRRGQAAPEPASDTFSAGSDPMPQTRRARRMLLKSATRLRKRGAFEEAAEMLWHGGELDRAADYFIEADQLSRAAEIRQDQNRFTDAAELYVQVGDFEAAGRVFAQQEEWSRAGECLEKAQSVSVAAEMYEKAGLWSRAAQCYDAVEFSQQAADCWVKAENWGAAAEALEGVFSEQLAKAKSDPDEWKALQSRARQMAALFQRAERSEAGLRFLEEAQCWQEAGELAQALDKPNEAADFFSRAGRLDEAAQALRRTGDEASAARLLGDHHREAGRLSDAAECLREAGDLGEAGDLYRQLEAFDKAGACYADQGDWSSAAEMYRAGDDRPRAAECYERAGALTEAAECWALEGRFLKEAELLMEAGQFLRAGEGYHREGRDEEAIAALQQVGPDDPSRAKAAAILADIFRGRGQLSLAIRQLDQVVGGGKVERASLAGFYALATLFEQDGDGLRASEIYEKILAVDYGYQDVQGRLARLKASALENPGLSGGIANGLPAGNGDISLREALSREGGRYQIMGELGRGGMGIVYKAQDTALDRMVAFKVLPDTVKENPQAVTNFMREARAAAKLNHPSIVTVYDTGEQDGHYYIAMEYVDGTTIKEILRRRGQISAAGILHVTVQICEALAYAHEKKLAHRDIKPANTMWTRDKKAKIMDFGLAKVVEEVRNHTTVVAGTPYYMSPEQTLGKNVDLRTDIYSLGVTMFEMATGTVPFKEGNIPYHHVHTPAPDVRARRPDLPLVIGQIIQRCLAKDPADRYQSAREILNEIRGSIAQS